MTMSPTFQTTINLTRKLMKNNLSLISLLLIATPVQNVSCAATYETTSKKPQALNPFSAFSRNKINIKNSKGFTPLMYAVKHNNEDIVRMFIAHGANINEKSDILIGSNRSDYTALMLAAEFSSVTVIHHLLDHGADVNYQSNYDGFTALLNAAARSKIENVRILLYYGANPNIPNFNGITPLIASIKNLDNKMTKLLLSYGAINNKKDILSRTSLTFAHQDGQEIIEPLPLLRCTIS